MSTEDNYLRVAGVSVRFGGVVALNDVSFSVAQGEICALIGPNGAGKTTMFNVLSRIQKSSEGAVDLQGQSLLTRPVHQLAGLGIARTFQNLGLFEGMTVLENVMVGAHRDRRRGLASEIQARAAAMDVLEKLDLASVASHNAAGLPYGTLKRIELARAMALRPRLLLLDEPAAGLAHGEAMELAQKLRELRDELDLTLVLVEHHMAMVMTIADHVVVLDSGRLLADGRPGEVQNNPLVIEAYLGSAA